MDAFFPIFKTSFPFLQCDYYMFIMMLTTWIIIDFALTSCETLSLV